MEVKTVKGPVDWTAEECSKVAALLNHPAWGLLARRLASKQEDLLGQLIDGIPYRGENGEVGRRDPELGELKAIRFGIKMLEYASSLPDLARGRYNYLMTEDNPPAEEEPGDEVSASPVPQGETE